MTHAQGTLWSLLQGGQGSGLMGGKPRPGEIYPPAGQGHSQPWVGPVGPTRQCSQPAQDPWGRGGGGDAGLGREGVKNALASSGIS